MLNVRTELIRNFQFEPDAVDDVLIEVWARLMADLETQNPAPAQFRARLTAALSRECHRLRGRPMKQRGEIVTRFLVPANPARRFDWQATRDGYEPGDPTGWGKTELEAILDLERAEDDAAEAVLPDVMDAIRRAKKRMRIVGANGARADLAQVASDELNKIFAAYDQEGQP